MRVLITGADGFIGRALARRLLGDPRSQDMAPHQVLLLDRAFAARPDDPRVRQHVGDIADPRLLRRALADGVQCVFHLAGILDAQAEREPALGQRANVGATLELFNQLRELARPPVLVFPSSMAVYGTHLPATLDEATPPNPQRSLGAHKLVAEVLLDDFSRHGWIDGRIVRLPALVARPAGDAGSSCGGLSGCMNELMHAMAEGKRCVLPISPRASSGWMSVQCAVDNLLQAARLRMAPGQGQRTWVMPALRLTIAEVVDALARRFGEDRRALVRHVPDAALEAAVGCYPHLRTPRAEAAGFGNDGDVDTLVARAFDP